MFLRSTHWYVIWCQHKSQSLTPATAACGAARCPVVLPPSPGCCNALVPKHGTREARVTAHFYVTAWGANFSSRIRMISGGKMKFKNPNCDTVMDSFQKQIWRVHPGPGWSENHEPSLRSWPIQTTDRSHPAVHLPFLAAILRSKLVPGGLPCPKVSSQPERLGSNAPSKASHLISRSLKAKFSVSEARRTKGDKMW